MADAARPDPVSRRRLPRLLGAAMLLGVSLPAAAEEYIDYWGDDLFLGLVYHRFGCHDDLDVTLSDRDYDGFEGRRYCFAGDPWYAPEDAGHRFLDWNVTSGRAELDACGAETNEIFGTEDYDETSSTCSYNIFTECNSDCWIEEFSSCQGYTIGTLSPCF